MANEHMKTCSTSYVIREMQIKTRYYICLLGRSKFGMLTIPNAKEDMEQKELSLVPGGNAKWYSHFGKQFGISLKN